MAESKSPASQAAPEVEMHPVVQVAVSVIGKDQQGRPELSDDGKKKIAEALEMSAADDTVVDGLMQLVAFAGYVDHERKMRDLAVQLLEVAAPWGPLIAKMAEDMHDPTGSDASVQRIREVANVLARKQVMRAPMVNEKAPEGSVRRSDLFIPRNFRL